MVPTVRHTSAVYVNMPGEYNMNQDRIDTFAGMLEVGVARLRQADLTLWEKQKTLEAMRGLSNKLAEEIKEHLLDNQMV